MRKANNIFAIVFALLGLMAIGAVIIGAWHQLFVAIMCFGMSAILFHENKRIEA